jgi:hypothetical protein
MKRFAARLVSLMLTGAVSLSLLAGCSINKPEDPPADVKNDPPPITEPDQQTTPKDTEIDEPIEEPDEPVISEDPEINDSTVEEPA